MKYAWEKAARKLALGIEEAFSGFGKDGKFDIFAVAVANHETGEAALIRLHHVEEGGVTAADFAGDVLGDAARMYSKAVKDMARGK